jgi:mono/diheme cytochrome c family protein
MRTGISVLAGACAAATMLTLAACGGAASTSPTTEAPAATGPTTAAPAVANTESAAVTSTQAMTNTGAAPAEEPAKPSNPGGPGAAIALTGDATAGAKVYVDNCKKCHADDGKGGVSNPGSTDETVPALNPIDSTLVNKDAKIFATNLDLFIEHGSTPAGTNPKNKMAAFGDDKTLTPQQIADVIAYVISLNKQPAQ